MLTIACSLAAQTALFSLTFGPEKRVWPNGQYGLVIHTPRKSRRANHWLLTLPFVLRLGERFEKYAYFNGSVYYPKG